MGKFRDVYDILRKDAEHKLVFKLDTSRARESILRTLEKDSFCYANGMEFSSDIESNCFQDQSDSWDTQQKHLSRGEQFLEHARMIKSFELNDGMVVDCDKYITEYGDMTYEQFCAYLCWRTQVRRRHYSVVSIEYLVLYLCEICNFVEYDYVENSWEALLALHSAYSNCWTYRKQIEATMFEFSVVYLSLDQVIQHDFDGTLQWLNGHLLFLQGLHTDPVSFLHSKASYKFRKNSVYKENPEKYQDVLIYFFENYVDFLNKQNINIVSLWIGKPKLTRFYSEHIKVIDTKFSVEKIYTNLDGQILLKVDKNSAQIVNMISLGSEVDPGQCIFGRSYIIDYPIRALENSWRRRLGKRKLKLDTSQIKEMCSGREHPLLSKILEIYESQSFDELIEKCLDDIL